MGLQSSRNYTPPFELRLAAIVTGQIFPLCFDVLEFGLVELKMVLECVEQNQVCECV